MLPTEIAPKEQFVEVVLNRTTKLYTLPVHGMGILLSICSSFYLTFCLTSPFPLAPLPKISTSLFAANAVLIHLIDGAGLFFVCLVSFVAVQFFYRMGFKGLSISTTSYYVTYKYSPVDFLMWRRPPCLSSA